MSENQSKFAIFQNADGEPMVAARFEDDDVWLTQKHLALLYKTTKQNVSQHIQSIFDSGELKESACVKKFFTVEEKFGRPAKIPVYHYNLDLIIALGYRIDSPVAIKFPPENDGGRADEGVSEEGRRIRYNMGIRY